MTFIYMNSQSWENSEPDHEIVGCFDISGVGSNLTIKTLVYLAATCSAKGTHTLKMEFIVSL